MGLAARPRVVNRWHTEGEEELEEEAVQLLWEEGEKKRLL